MDRGANRTTDRGMGRPAGRTLSGKAVQLVDALPEQAILLAGLGHGQGGSLGGGHSRNEHAFFGGNHIQHSRIVRGCAVGVDAHLGIGASQGDQ